MYTTVSIMKMYACSSTIRMWKIAQPSDDALRGDWWRLFGEPELEALEAREGDPAPLAIVPISLVRPVTQALYRLPGFPLTPDQLLMLEEDNTCDPSAFFSTFGLTPVALGSGLRSMLG